MRNGPAARLAGLQSAYTAPFCVCALQPASVDDAVSVVVDTITGAAVAGGNRQVLAAAVKALLSLSGCLNCRCFYDK